MKYAIMSDVHANPRTLETALADAARVTIRRLPFDFKGYVTEMLAHEIDLPSWLCDLLQKLQARGGDPGE